MPAHGARERQNDDLHNALRHQQSYTAKSPTSPPVVASTQHLCALIASVLVFHVLTSVIKEHIFHLPGFSNVLLLSFGETLCTTVLVAGQVTWSWWWSHTKQRGGGEREAPRVLSLTFASRRFAASSLLRRCCVMSSRVSKVVGHIFHPSTVKLRWYVCIALLMSCSLYLTNRSSLVLSYPVQVIFKSSKLLCMVLVRRWWVRTANERDKSVTDEEAREGEVDEADVQRVHSAYHMEATNICPAVPRQPSFTTSLSCGSAFASPISSSVVVAVAVAAAAVVARADDAVRVSVQALSSERTDGRQRRGATEELSPETPTATTHSRENSMQHPHRIGAHMDSDRGGVPAHSGSSALSWLLQMRRFVRSCRLTPHRLRRRLCLDRRQLCTSLVVMLPGAPTAAGRAFSTQRGMKRLLRAAVHRARGLLRDGELQACTMIVLGLILFTCASLGEELAVSTAAAAALDAADVSPHVVVSSIGLPQHNDSTATTSDALAAASTGMVDQAWTAVCDWYTLWFVAVVGVLGALLSNFIDAVIYMMEEVYCFMTAGERPTTAAAAAAPPATTTATTFPRVAPEETREHSRGGSGTAAAPSVSPSFHPAYNAHGEAMRGAEWLAATSDAVALTPVCPPAPLCFPTRVSGETVEVVCPPASASASSPSQIPASSQEVVLMVNGIATLLYGGGLVLPWLLSQLDGSLASSLQLAGAAASAPPPPPPFPLFSFTLLMILASLTSLIGTLSLLAIVAAYTGVTAVIVTSLRKTLTILLSFVLYGRGFTPVHAVGLTGVISGVVWNELLRRHQAPHKK